MHKTLFVFDILLVTFSAVFLSIHFVFYQVWLDFVLAGLSSLGLLPVLFSAIRSFFKRQISVDLLASIALIFSLLSHEWFSATFITLMLAFARIFDYVTEARTKRIIQSLMKYHVEWVRIKDGETVKDIHMSALS